jgi:hypothetical protein
MKHSQSIVKTLAAACTLTLASQVFAAPVAAESAHRPAYADSRQTTSPFDSLGGVGGRGTAHAGSTEQFAMHGGDHTPWDSLGGIGGQGTNRSSDADQIAMHGGDHTPWDSLGGIGGQGTNRSVERLTIV